jgi:hypothetical protein
MGSLDQFALDAEIALIELRSLRNAQRWAPSASLGTHEQSRSVVTDEQRSSGQKAGSRLSLHLRFETR